MRKILLSRWLLSGVGTVLLAALVWVFGPFVAVLEPVLPRAGIVLMLVLIWALANWWIDHRARARDRALAAGVSQVDPTAAAEESDALRERLAQALGRLRQARGTRGWLYEQPWYVVIGPPGAGKTTALLNSGLTFPLADAMGHGAVAGVGGTRLCDWWFTDDAVLIDTAGRYTTQDSDAVVDRAGWETFLNLLKRTRARQPLNGVIVAIGLSDIAGAPAAERLAQAATIRRRLKELREKLGVELPVYVLFTKADLIAGFCEYFDDLDREARGQVCGSTFALKQPVADFATMFRALVARLDARLLDRMQAERSPDRRALIASFPAQVGSLAQPLQEFLDAAFAGSRLDAAPLLRGVYLTSGTQEGTPIDRLTGAMARSFGIDQRRAPTLRPEHGRGYFLTRLLRHVMLGEAMLVAEPPGTARRRAALRTACYVATGLAVLGAGGWLWNARASNAAAVDVASARLEQYRQAAARLPLDPVSDGDLATIAPLLAQARTLSAGDNGGAILSQSEKLAAAGQSVYRDALQRVLLPRLIVRLEAQMRAGFDKPDFLYHATRVDLMLGGQGPLDRELVRTWMRLDWERDYAGDATLRRDLAAHLDALLAEPLPPVSLDGGLIDQARVTFSRVPVAERVYSRIVPSAAAQALPAWRPSDILGSAGAELFVRASGRPLSDGIPGLYRPDGFRTVLLDSLPEMTRQVAAESWVLGRQSQIDTSGPALQALQQQVVQLYEADYVRQWDTLSADLSLAPAPSLQQAAERLYVLSSPQSPLRTLLTAMAHELTLAPPPAPATATQATLQGVIGAPATPAPDGHEIDQHYKPLRDFVGNGPGAPIDMDLAVINALQQSLAQLASAPVGAPVGAPVVAASDPLLTLRAAASQAPQPMRRWLTSMASAGAALRAGGTRQQVVAAFAGADGPAQLCARAAQGRYPFDARSATDIPLDDFSRLFAPGGQIDAFFNEQLRPLVDTTGAVWTARAAAGSPVSDADLAQFRRANAIRQLFFPAGATTPSLPLEITPFELDAGSKQVTLDLGGGTSIVYAHDVARATPVVWPAQGGSGAKMVFDTGATIAATGPWALFRLIGAGTLQPDGAPDRFTLTFRQGDHHAVFAIRTSSIATPWSGALTGFRCPALR